MSADSGPDRGYWYTGEEGTLALLMALRRFRRADQEMRRRVSADMDVNLTDMQALQFVIAAEQRREPASPRQLSAHLGISTASTTKLVDRLSASGHLCRVPHATDRRSLVLHATARAHQEVRARLSRMHRRMAQVAAAVPEPSRQAVVDFLEAMADALDEEPGPTR